MASPDKDVVATLFEGLGRGDLDAVLACLHEDIAIRDPATGPALVGRDAVRSLLWKRVAAGTWSPRAPLMIVGQGSRRGVCWQDDVTRGIDVLTVGEDGLVTDWESIWEGELDPWEAHGVAIGERRG